MRRFIDFKMLTFLDKFVLGFTATFGKIISSQDLVYTLLTSLLAIYVFTNYKEKLYRVIALFPLISILALGHLSPITFGIFPELETFSNDSLRYLFLIALYTSMLFCACKFKIKIIKFSYN